jgi:hypothetical protein
LLSVFVLDDHDNATATVFGSEWMRWWDFDTYRVIGRECGGDLC